MQNKAGAGFIFRNDKYRNASILARGLALVVTITFCMFSADDAFAAKRHNPCSNQLRHSHNKCASAKHHRGRHIAVARPQPASLIMDADTGRVLESQNPDSLRYPASLTKMMTLYLTFEALDKGKIKLDTKMPVSANASSQPQTNIALHEGDRLAVKDAILSLVVRSANDSAMVLGEAIGGSESGFANKMTEKALKLGMKNTVFYNPNGLPDPRQHTTARDMAILGLALRKHFPQYFPFFKTEVFSYNGVTYTTHNHVMMRYDGVDGIKTGYIRASGYNLVTSAKKDGHTLVGVVLGGRTFRERDDKMIAMLDRNFTTMSAHSAPGAVRIATARPILVTPENSADNAEDEEADGQGDATAEAAKNKPSEFAAPVPPVISEKKLASASPSASGDAVKLKTPAKETADAAKAKATQWGIQIGLFSKKSEAVSAASRAMKLAPRALGSSQISVPDQKVMSQYRARLVHLSEAEAQEACNALEPKKISCYSFRE